MAEVSGRWRGGEESKLPSLRLLVSSSTIAGAGVGFGCGFLVGLALGQGRRQQDCRRYG